MSFIFFLLFALSLLTTYMAVRRQWTTPMISAAGGIIASILTMTLYLIARGSSPLQGVVMGVLIGGVLGAATLAMAWYFQSNEIRAMYATQEGMMPEAYTQEDYGEVYPPAEEDYES